MSGREETAMMDVRLREVPERVLLVERRKVVLAELEGFVADALTAHRRVLEEAGVGPAAPAYTAFAGPLTDEVAGTVEVCTPVPDEVARREDLPLRVEPAHREAFTTVTRREFDYPAVLDAYALVETWASDQGLAPAAPPREIYWGDIEHAQDDEPVVEVAQPVR